MKKRKLERRGLASRVSKVAGSVFVAAAVAASMTPAAALGATVGDTVYYRLPSTPIETVHKDGNTQWEHLKAWQSSPPVGCMTVDMLGINNLGYGSMPDSSQVVDGMVAAGSARYAIVLGLYGSEMNENPDEYLWNYACYINGAKVDAEKRVVGSSANVTVTVGGTTYANMPPEIYYECNFLLGNNLGPTSTKNEKTYQEWIDIENARWDEAYGTRSDDEKYSPVYGSIGGSGGSVYSGSAVMYKNAATADEKIEASKDSDGKYKLRTRYANGPETYKFAQAFEAISKGPQYYVLSQLAAGKIKKKTVALLCGYDPSTEFYACRVLDGGNRDTTNRAGNYADNLVAIADDITVKLGDNVAAAVYDQDTEGAEVRWYTKQQIVDNCDAVIVPDCNQASRQAKAPSDGVGYTVYAQSMGGKDDTTGTKHIEPLINAQQANKANGKSYPDILYEWPAQMAGYYSTMAFEVNLTSPVMCAFLYPDAINYTDAVAYWDKTVYHIKDAFVQETVDVTCHSASLSRSQSQIGAVSGNYVAKMSKILLEGYQYYKDNKADIDKIKSATGVDGSGAEHGVIEAYDMDMFDSYMKVLEENVPAVTPAAKKAQTITAKKTTVTKTYKAKAKTKKLAKKKTVKAKRAFGLKAKTTMTYAKKSGNSKITVKKSNGVITIKKGLKKGTYKVKIKVTAKATSAYKAASKTVTLKVKIK